MAIFKKNLTSKILSGEAIKVLNSSDQKEKKILEIGCGDGNITQFLIDNQLGNNQFYCSDISEEAIDSAKKNIVYDKINLKAGAFFDPWKNFHQSFDLVITDVSSISEPVADKSDWYNGVTSDCGENGLKNVKIILDDVNFFLNKDGYFILPVISLCRLDELYELLKKKFNFVSYSEKVEWPLPEFFKKNIHKFDHLIKKKIISVEYKFGAYLAFTKVAICHKHNNQ